MKIVIMSILIVLTCSCASIISKSDYPVHIISEPPGKQFVIKQHGVTISKGETPSTQMLSSSEGFWNPANYEIIYDNGKMHTMNASLDGWWIGNLFIWPVIGGLIVDPATGAIWKLPKQANLTD